ncbi:MAG: SDR family NAD(P)-dependent oxidoreductase [Spirochaetes bacterium]|jgi:all-trans-retinol dehydrogenase (NAD+)|nr:SDR family NAD(P)-dependent oxidoreductase [Spirochaetota bacterium]
MHLEGKGAIVTGGAKGIGLHIAGLLLDRGTRVALWDVDRQALEEAAEELSGLGQVAPFPCDVRDSAAVNEAVQRSLTHLGGIDVLVNNAGYMAPGFFLDQPVEAWHKTVEINLQGIINVTHAALPFMYEAGRGHVVNISSAAGFLGVPGLATYSATKWAVFGLTESLREESWAQGHREVRFSSVHPNFIKTGMFEGAQLRGLGAVLFPRVDGHNVIAEAVVLAALLRGRRVVKRPRSLRLILLLRGILPDRLFGAIGRLAKLHTSMDTWRGLRRA